MSAEIMELEIRKGRHRLVLRKVYPGPFLKVLNATASAFFYEVKLDGKMQVFCENPMEVRAIWQECHRFMMRKFPTPKLLP
jgi:hypothetical protein